MSAWREFARPLALAAVSAVWCVTTAVAQTNADSSATARPMATAVRVQEKPVLDGDVIGDPVWQQATPISTFWQEQPDEGQPASERTEVRMVYTNDTLYVGVVCYDRTPDNIIVSDTRRDSPLDNTDSFQMVFDSTATASPGSSSAPTLRGLSTTGR